MPFLQLQSRFENKDLEYGYCVFNNSTPVNKFPLSMVGVIPVKHKEEIVLASDSYPQLMPTLDESDAKLQESLLSNPLCSGDYKSTKGLQNQNQSFDDRTYVRFIV